MIQGRHLVALGYAPARWFGAKLDACCEAQLDSRFENEQHGLEFLKQLLQTPST